MKVILISGKAGSGKSTLQQALKMQLETLTYTVGIARFAQPVYEAHTSAMRALIPYGIPPVAKDRRLLQLIGTEWGRLSRGENIWVECLNARLADLKGSGHDFVLVDDLRFKNEKNFNYCADKLTIRLSCPDEVRAARLPGRQLPPEHVSECDLDADVFDYHFDSSVNSASDIAKILVKMVTANAAVGP